MKILDVPQSGALAGIVASRNRYGQYYRTRTIPVQPRTPAQLAVRATLSDLSAAWRGLTDHQRDGWRSMADKVSRHNSLGQVTTPTGHQLYVSVNSVRALITQSRLDDPPGIPTFNARPQYTWIVQSDPPTVQVILGPSDVDSAFLFECSPPRSAGRNFNDRYRLLDTETADVVEQEFDLTPAYLHRFGAPQPGSKVWCRATEVKAGQKAQPEVTLLIVAQSSYPLSADWPLVDAGGHNVQTHIPADPPANAPATASGMFIYRFATPADFPTVWADRGGWFWNTSINFNVGAPGDTYFSARWSDMYGSPFGAWTPLVTFTVS